MALLYDADALDGFLKFVSFEDGPLIALHSRRGKYGYAVAHRQTPHIVKSADEVRALCASTPNLGDNVLYLDMCPRSWTDAFVAFNAECVGRLAQKQALERLDDRLRHHLACSVLRNTFMEVDVDTKDPEVLVEVQRHCGDLMAATVETRNGYHVIYRPPMRGGIRSLAEYCRANSSVCSLRRTAAPPLPGTLQGGFKVRMLT